MCCYRLDTKFMMVYFFEYCHEQLKKECKVLDLKKYINFIAGSFPGYVSSDFSEKTIMDFCDRYCKQYKYNKNGTITAVENLKVIEVVDLAPDYDKHIRHMSKLYFDEVCT